LRFDRTGGVVRHANEPGNSHLSLTVLFAGSTEAERSRQKLQNSIVMLSRRAAHFGLERRLSDVAVADLLACCGCAGLVVLVNRQREGNIGYLLWEWVRIRDDPVLTLFFAHSRGCFLMASSCDQLIMDSRIAAASLAITSAILALSRYRRSKWSSQLLWAPPFSHMRTAAYFTILVGLLSASILLFSTGPESLA